MYFMIASCLVQAVVEAPSSQNILKLGIVMYHTMASNMATTNQAISPHSYETVADTVGAIENRPGQHWGANFSRSLEA